MCADGKGRGRGRDVYVEAHERFVSYSDRNAGGSQRMAGELSRVGGTHRLVLFARQQHSIGGRGADRDAAAIEWFQRFGGG